MPTIRFYIIFVLILASSLAQAQKKQAQIRGQVVDDDEKPLAGATITILGKVEGVATDDSGYFKLTVTANKAFALEASAPGRRSEQKNFNLLENEDEFVVFKLVSDGKLLQEVIIKNKQEREEIGQFNLNPKTALLIPSTNIGVESLIKILVGSNNELTSQYNVRGGSYDENIIYVNDFEVFRPYLISSGQQEGLSFINPNLVSNLNFYNGGFPARYGDKMSSVLDIEYKQPRKTVQNNKVKNWGGSAYVSPLEQGVHVEGISHNERFTYLVGARNRSNRNLLSSQETTGNYVPASADLQMLFTYSLSPKWKADLFGNLSQATFSLIPESSQLTTSVLSPYFSQNLALNIDFEGREKDAYKTKMVGLTIRQKVNDRLNLKWMASAFQNKEEENVDIAGAYVFGERDFDANSSTFGLITNPLGAGIFQNYSRNKLDLQNISIQHKGSLDKDKHFVQWGVGFDKTSIDDKLHEWELQDSAGYSLPFNPDLVTLNKVLKSKADLSINKFSGYLQDNFLWKDGQSNIIGGVRFNYNDLNKEFIITPRISINYKPKKNKDMVIRGALGAYYQPPFYRELRRYNGTINRDVVSQKSWQAVAGFDYNFIGFGRRRMRFTTEAYYKRMTDVVPYDIDNVRIRYFGENNAKAYAMGIEMRLFGELVKDAESWISLGIMKTAENIENDFYFRYKNAAGEYTDVSEDKVPVESVRFEKGWVRRPTDRRITFGMFFQDYLATNKNFKMYLNLIFGSNLPYNLPNNTKYRGSLIIPEYIRADIGFSALLLDSDRSKRRSHNPFLGFNNIWASLEVFNLIDRDNTISYLLIKDFSNTTYTLPQRLTPRLLNFKIVARW